jgi:SAM-dependent methyltransferase
MTTHGGSVPFLRTALDKAHRFRTDVSEVAARRGLAAALGTAAALSVGSARRAGAYLLETAVDLKLGTTTRGMVRNERVLTASAGADGHVYQPVPVRKFRRILAASTLRPGDTTFLDLGAGRGRALLLAADAGFRRVIGIELDPGLAADARRNLARHAQRRSAEAGSVPTSSVLCHDAADVVLPPGPVLVFVYNSFGPWTLRRVLERIEESVRHDPRLVQLAYHNPVHAEVVEARPAFVRTAGGRDWALFTVARRALLLEPVGCG